MNAEFGALKSWRLPAQQAAWGMEVQERCLLTFAELLGAHTVPPATFTFAGGWSRVVSCYAREQHPDTVSWASVTRGGWWQFLPQTFGSLDICHEEYHVREDLFTGCVLLGLKSNVTIQSHRFTKLVLWCSSLWRLVKRHPNWKGGVKLSLFLPEGKDWGKGQLGRWGLTCTQCYI